MPCLFFAGCPFTCRGRFAVRGVACDVLGGRGVVGWKVLHTVHIDAAVVAHVLAAAVDILGFLGF